MSNQYKPTIQDLHRELKERSEMFCRGVKLLFISLNKATKRATGAFRDMIKLFDSMKNFGVKK